MVTSMVSKTEKQESNGGGRNTRGRFAAGNRFGCGSNRRESRRKKPKRPPLPRRLLGRGLEDVWAALCDEAVGGNLKAQMEAFRLSDVPVASSKTEAERAEELSDADYDLLEALPEDLQALCVQNHLSPTTIRERHGRELPLSDDESSVAEALEAVADEDY